MDSRIIGKYVRATLWGKSASGITEIWVITGSGDVVLGHVKWYAPWRMYCFLPERGYDTVFSPDCLDSISTFARDLTKAHVFKRIGALTRVDIAKRKRKKRR